MLKEDKRQLFHMFFGIGFAILLFLDRTIGIIGILAVLLWGLPHYIYSTKKRIPITIKSIMDVIEREGERGGGAIRFVIGCLVAAFFFPTNYSIPAILVFSISDALATSFGIRYGRREGKSIEGSLVFFFSSLIVLVFYFNPIKSIITALVSALIEFLVKKDNIILAPSIAFILYFLPV